MFAARDEITTLLVWRGTHAEAIWGVKATGKPVEVGDFAVWRFRDGKVVEISTIQDRFALLKQIGYLQEEIYAAQPGPSGRDLRTVAGGPHLRRRAQARS